MVYWLVKWVFLGPLLRLFFRPKIEGAEHIPAEGGAILASNHLAVSDSFFLPLKVSRRVTFPAKIEYFTAPGIKGKLKKLFFTGVGQIPIDRSGGSAAQAAIATGVRLLREGHLMGIYPEGTRSPDGRLYKGKTGIARIALQAGVPVIPVAMFGTDKANPIGSKMWRPYPIRIKIGKPLDFSRYEGLEGDRFVERSITDEIMYALMELSGQEYVDVYAAKAKELQAAHDAGTVTDVPTQLKRDARIPETEAS
ncbi:1-acyl-sn-glycerol-3-phosphate acyltransferase [Actinokineospora alba]|uniref:1-acyl-sn-glycerol-3-phosphate acyltransferase n=1 Tax=Actinokineospora alba TaxID=504798 RepID=A0A1H0JM06_9PSEU|nr:lysophospholipid acyltransferase family protein [Actinokineospora alba]TDP68245.1 1-acyl-sn-glycerol-3-phosphate acyltransferase [Actinokineospora alba]SDH95060.1 1-acyl-sn-glycerol-3-phosphate acyltransferase [Actinokineospora alba]SDO44654.1 1-acyl-sn-glycerol-3-phosphate acyltransferase [Actinokineospora alba]